MPFPIHPHMLRHACGFKLANAGLAALPRAQEHSAHSQVHRDGARPFQGLLERLTLALGILVPPLPGAGKLGTTSASPSITLALAPRPAARCAIRLSMASRVRSSSSSVIALTPPECSNFISRGTSIAQTFKYAAGDSRRTRLKTSRPCCCQSSARSSRKRLLKALRVASGEPPGFPENPGRYWPLALRSRRRARGIASWFCGVGLIRPRTGRQCRLVLRKDVYLILSGFQPPPSCVLSMSVLRLLRAAMAVCQWAGKPLMIKLGADRGLPA